MKILTVVGARPQFIKVARVSAAMGKCDNIEEILVHTGQHYDASMSAVFFEELNIPKPNYALGIGSASHGAQTGRMLEAIEEVLEKEAPDFVLVYGDTNSTLAGALAAIKLHVPIAHVEAGLRSYNRRMPEEINRVLTDHAADILLTPTTQATTNLLKEGISPERIHQVGDVMYDTTLHFSKLAKAKPTLGALGLVSKGYMLATIHRAENTDHPVRLKAIVEGLIEVARDIPVVLPLHPRTEKALRQFNLMDKLRASVQVVQPLGYLDMMNLESGARLIVTDSGGVQKEAYFMNVPCVTLRDETEWLELVEAGWNHLAPPHDSISVSKAIRDAISTEPPQVPLSGPYGCGDAAESIVKILENWPSTTNKSISE